MNPSRPIQVKVDYLDRNGSGVISDRGKSIAVPGVIPGETLRVQMKANGSLKLLEVVTPSPDRVTPPCPYFLECGGCQWQHIRIERQVQEKEAWLRREFGDMAAGKIRPILSAPESYHYRRRIQLHVGPKGELGYFATNSHRVVEIQACEIASLALNQHLPQARELALKLAAEPRRPSMLRLEMTEGMDGAVALETNPEEREFLQVNPGANAKLQEVLLKAMSQINPRVVVEFFAGEGNLTYALMQKGQAWHAVELNAAAVEKGRATARAKGLEVHWYGTDAGSFFRNTQHRSADLLLLDPPRAGAPTALKSLRGLGIPHLLYVSCSPPSLARDAKTLSRLGYELQFLQPIDFFPQTMHLETVALFNLSRQN